MSQHRLSQTVGPMSASLTIGLECVHDLGDDCSGRGVDEPALKARPSPGARDPGSVTKHN